MKKMQISLVRRWLQITSNFSHWRLFCAIGIWHPLFRSTFYFLCYLFLLVLLLLFNFIFRDFGIRFGCRATWFNIFPAHIGWKQNVEFSNTNHISGHKIRRDNYNTKILKQIQNQYITPNRYKFLDH